MGYASQNNYWSPPLSNVRPFYNAGQPQKNDMYSPPSYNIEELSDEELEQELKYWEKKLKRAKRREYLRRLQEELYKLESRNSFYSRDKRYIQKSTSANDLSNFSEHHSGHPQRSAHLQPATQGPESTVRARAITSSTSANVLSNFSEHQSGHPQRSAHLYSATPGPESTIRTRVRTPSTSTNDLSNISEH